MNSALKKLLITFAYGVVGLALGLVIPALHADPTVLGSFTGGFVVVLTAIQEAYFPTQTVASAKAQIAAASAPQK